MADQPASANAADGEIVVVDKAYADKLERSIKKDLRHSASCVCTYKQGYISQPIYACKTCTTGPEGSEPTVLPAAICESCAAVCHEGHQVFSLYGKRDIRCDCGNERQAAGGGVGTCKFFPVKDGDNVENAYNVEHNYFGRYCWCDRAEEESTHMMMVQCTLCQDWYHKACIDERTAEHGGMPDLSQFAAFVCSGCADNHTILTRYRSLYLLGASDTAVANSDKPETADCGLPASPATSVGLKLCLFMRPEWRLRLCRCASCVDKYAAEKISFVLTELDNFTADGEHEDVTEQDLDAEGTDDDDNDGNDDDEDDNTLGQMVQNLIQTLPPAVRTQIQASPVILDRMTRVLTEELRPYAESGEVVTPDVIHRAFSRLRERDSDEGFAASLAARRKPSDDDESSRPTKHARLG
ncbi:hypothetical protein CAOG_00722 [Capsaspora owczarzaki ATCC 30864]|uniref:UBR-type domain-containing protein n=1 Tax=Capsaspora owczarzaki (strain ATCC 30864) TaxID=595528 RepID=A0A0D2VH09_CAPO3|nr:hypothetical protein CAOG_00722 [Capsaspora owczarzaki ATCC 30864]KJE89202.1 hypothetical protein CAOG_000722 [Capsaspora owczarzaki ATCC 30864]|eukprot:XP_004365593.2 hypothetical protein CAOG_00722 [Capsaspora owczarzaki ATCC 30864]